MELLFNEKDLVESVCVYAVEKECTIHKSLNVNLAFNPFNGFSATAHSFGSTRNLNEQEIVDAVGFYLSGSYNFDPDLLFVDLRFSEIEGITASIQVINY